MLDISVRNPVTLDKFTSFEVAILVSTVFTISIQPGLQVIKLFLC